VGFHLHSREQALPPVFLFYCPKGHRLRSSCTISALSLKDFSLK
jgi:hypothetical protein